MTCAILVSWTQCLQTLIKTHWKWTGLKILDSYLVNELELGSGTLRCSGQKGKMVPLSARAHCLADVIITQRVHVCTMRRTLPVWASGGQSSLYAVCRAPRQKHCWAVKHSVTKTTCSWVVDRQTQTASAAPHQEFVPYHRGLWGLLFWLQSNTLLRHDAFYTYLETQIGTRLLSDNNTFRRISIGARLFGLKRTCPDT